MADQPNIRLNKVLRELNISLDRAVEFLNQKGLEVDARPTTKITSEVYSVLLDEFETDKSKNYIISIDNSSIIKHYSHFDCITYLYIVPIDGKINENNINFLLLLRLFT